MRRQISYLKSAVMAAAMIFSALSGAIAESFVGSTVESRLILGFKVEDAKAAALLPDGWAPLTFPQGPLTGANMLVTFMDRHLIRDAEGNPATPVSGRAAAMVVYGVQAGAPPRLFIVRVFEPAPMTDRYGNSIAAELSRKLEAETGSTGLRAVEEEWQVRSEAGNIEVSMEYAGVPLGWSEDNEALPYSAVNPGFNRIYRYDQMIGLVLNAAMGLDMSSSASFSASGPELDDLFSGISRPVVALTVPVYVRDVFLP